MGSFQGQMGTIDSAGWLLGSIVDQLNRIEGALAIIGFCYTTKLVITHGWSILKAIKLYVYEPLFGSKRDWVNEYGKWAVVTGATDGVGKEYAIQLASKGMNIVLISRSQEKLIKVANEIATDYRVETKIIAVDFGGDAGIYDKIEAVLEKLEVGLLVNNVGVFPPYPMYLTEMDRASLWQHIAVNTGAVTMMSRIVLPGMVARKKGGIINISSGASVAPIPLISTYSATKVYVNYFSDGIRREYSRYGITVQCLQPYYIATNMTSYSDRIGKPSFFVPSARQYVRSSLGTFGKTDTLSGYFPHDLMRYGAMQIPQDLYISMAHGQQISLRNDAIKPKTQ